MRWHGIVLLLLLAPDAFGGEVITGTARFRERIMVPPEAVFEATLEDVSRADAPADVLGQVRVDSPGNPPIRFEIAYDATLNGWVRALDLRDKETEGHTQRVTTLTIHLAKLMGIEETEPLPYGTQY